MPCNKILQMSLKLCACSIPNNISNNNYNTLHINRTKLSNNKKVIDTVPEVYLQEDPFIFVN